MKPLPRGKWLLAASACFALGLGWYCSHDFTRHRTQEEPAGKSRSALPRMAAVAAWQVETEGGEKFIVSLNHCAVPGPEGAQHLHRLEPPANPATLRSRLATLDASPVVFSEDGQMRIVTSDIEVRLDGGDVAALALQSGLTVKSLPDYAPGWVILHAVDPLAALSVLPGLRASPGVVTAVVALAHQQTLRSLPNDPLILNQWHLKTSGAASPGTDLNVESVWNYGGATGLRGAGVSIGIIDDGLEQTHPDLLQNVDTSDGWDWNGNDADPSPGPGDRHGTACAGLAAARGNNSLGVSGVAPEAALVGMRLIAAPTTDEQEAGAMIWKKDLIQVKSNSWGPADTGKILEGPGPLTLAALESAAKTGRGGRGTIFIWAGGNGQSSGDNSNYDGYANSIYTIATAAMDSTGNAAYYSEPGANLLICAPSDGSTPALGISTTDLTGTGGYNTASSLSGGDYTNDFGGTSAATPQVAGVVALMLERNPQLGWRDVQEILVRSATKIRPADSGWVVNGAGFHFHPRFGAGLVNAAAAVSLAAGWENLPAQESVSQAVAGPAAIPENTAVGVIVPFHISGAGIRVEQVTLTADISHTSRGNLEIVLTSPAGTQSRLAEVHSDTNHDFPSWTFSTVRDWGESGDGDWTLKIADRSPAGNTTGGTLNSATLKLFGAPIIPKNPPPTVAIVAPSSSAVFSPGATVAVQVSASDLTVDGSTGNVVSVEILDNGVSAGSRSSPPYAFELALTDGSHELVARATDDEGAFALSTPVTVVVQNRPPVVSAAALDAFGQAYADRVLRVQSVSANDPDGTNPAISYQWQSSDDGLSWHDLFGANAAELPATDSHAGKLWRCDVTASDGELASQPFFSQPVNLLARPRDFVPAGIFYSYQSGLVLAGTPVTPTRRAIIHEFSQGPAGGNSEWVEILVLQKADLGYWDLSDTTKTLVFKASGVWSSIPAGTLIVVYNGNTLKDPALPADDPDPLDGKMVVSSTDPTFFDSAFDSWIPLLNGGDSISLHDAGSVRVHSLSYGNGSGPGPHLTTVGSATAAFFTGDNEAAADTAAAWQTTAANGAVTPGAPNNTANAGFVASLRNGAPVIPARFSLPASTVLPAGLALDSITGLISGTVTGAPGNYEVRIRRTNDSGGSVSQGFVLTVGLVGGYDGWIAGFPTIADHAVTADPDGDGLPNLVEYALVSSPDSIDFPLAFGSDITGISLDYRVSKLRSDVEIVPEWSADPGAGPWISTGIEIQKIGEDDNFQQLRITLAMDPAIPRKFLRLRAIRLP